MKLISRNDHIRNVDVRYFLQRRHQRIERYCPRREHVAFGFSIIACRINFVVINEHHVMVPAQDPPFRLGVQTHERLCLNRARP